MAAEECRKQLCQSMSQIGARTNAADRVLILSGGVDTCAILAAAMETNVAFAAAITVITSEDSPDRPFAAAAAAEHTLPHHIVFMTTGDLVERHLPACVNILKTFDGMTLRNSLVVAAAMQKASELGFKHAIVGDGADELLGGYSFMWKAKDAAEWKEKRDSMVSKWSFATSDLAAAHGLTSHSPYMEPDFVAWAIASAQMENCIGVRQIQLELDGERIEHETGKIVLREAFATLSSWRRKDPIEVGSGATVIGHDDFWAQLIPDAAFDDEKRDAAARGFQIKNKEHLANFRAFEHAFGRDGVKHPKARTVGQGCLGCCFELPLGEMFCHVCGAYPAQKTGA
uniref:Asparagine synthetase domain-containing protein n=1 Tax=Chrysotila carterae TaxID=13221 RepID=A0A7S4B143_CHRCT